MTTADNSPDLTRFDRVRPIAWEHDCLRLLDQRVLPQQELWLDFHALDDAAQAITDMVVRGAPAIGITAAFAVVLAVRQRYAESPDNWVSAVAPDLERLLQARPTAVNLRWAVELMRQQFVAMKGDPAPQLLSLARQIHENDIAANREMGRLGSSLITADSSVLTHCNTGSLATGGFGTALGVIRYGVADGKIRHVFADETRPWLQGSRLTAWELVQDQIPVTLLADAAAAHLMHQGKVDWVIVGSDRIAANGDVANKIGTYSAAVAARHHGVKFMVVAPTTTVDMNAASGDDIPIEQRAEHEVLSCGGKIIAAHGAQAWNPAFDVTPAELVDVIVTEKGIVEQPTTEKMALMMA
jgi:methylthioribose-1-phosphate isomerase